MSTTGILAAEVGVNYILRKRTGYSALYTGVFGGVKRIERDMVCNVRRSLDLRKEPLAGSEGNTMEINGYFLSTCGVIEGAHGIFVGIHGV